MSNQEILARVAKADAAVADLVSGGGYLTPKVAEQFIKGVSDQAVIMQKARVVTMVTPSQVFPKIKFTGRVLKPGVENTAFSAAQRVKPTFDKYQVDTVEVKSVCHLSYELLEDNVEKAQLQQTILAQLQEAVAADMEDMLLNGDTTSGDELLALKDGIRKLCSAHTVNAGGAALLSDTLLSIKKTLPHKYLRFASTYNFLTSHNALAAYRNQMAQRGTALGDSVQVGTVIPMYQACPVTAVDKMPENLLGGGNKTECLFTDPKNIVIGWWRNIRVETDRDIEAGAVKLVLTARFGWQWEETDAAVKATNILAT